MLPRLPATQSLGSGLFYAHAQAPVLACGAAVTLCQHPPSRPCDCLSASYLQVETSVRQGLAACGWRPQSGVEWAVDWAMSGA